MATKRKPLTTSTSVVTSRDPKGRKFIEVVEAAYNKAGLTNEEAQRVNEAGGLQEVITEFIAPYRSTNQFAGEEVQSYYTYPRGYKIKGITEQTNILRQLFPGVGYADEKIAEQPLPPSAEGWFAIPKWQTLAPTYGEAVEKVLAMISQTRDGRFNNILKRNAGPNNIRQHQRTLTMLEKLGNQQKTHDILIVPAQFGLRHRGSSVRRAREAFATNEFGLGAFAVGIMLLTHPEREVQRRQLHVDCAGDEFTQENSGRFPGAPRFYFSDVFEFSDYWFDSADKRHGSASAFVS